MLRARIRDVVFEAEPPWVEIPPAWGAVKPNFWARVLVVVFSRRVRAGETA